MPDEIDIEQFGRAEPAPESDTLISTLMNRKRRKIIIKLDSEEKSSLAIRIVQDFFDASAVNAEFRNNHVEFINNWRGTPVPNPDGPLGDQSSAIKVPLTSTFIEQWKARLSKIILGDDNLVKFYSLVEPLEEGILTEIAKWFKWELINVVNLPKWLDAIFHYVFVDGIALPVPYYDRIVDRRVSCREFELRTDAPILAQIDAAIQQTFAAMGYRIIQSLPDVEDGTYQVTLENLDNPAYITVLIEDELLVLEIDCEEVIFDGVSIELPNLEDVIIVNSAEEVKDLPFFGIRCWLSAVEVDQLIERELFDVTKAEFENVLAFASAKISDFIPQQVTREQDIVEGADSLGTSYVRGNDYERRWIEIYRWEGWIWYKNRRVGVAVWLAPRSFTILRIEFLENLNKDGERSPVKHSFIPVPGRFYAVGLAEWLRNVQTEMDGIHNFRLNSALISTVPYGFYSPLAGFTQGIFKLQPGNMYPVKDPSSVNFPKISWSPIWGFQEEGLVRKYASELSGMGDPGVGTYTSKRTSATEFMGTAQATDLRTEYIAKNLLRSVECLLYRIFGLYQQHAKGDRIFQIAGADGKDLVKKLSMDRIQGKLKLQLTGDVRQLSKDLERQMSMSMLSIIMNPFTLQLGIVKADTIYSAMKKVFDASDYKGVPLHMPDVPPDSPAPAEELKMMMAGVYPPPHAGEDFGMHLQAHTMTAARPDLPQMMHPEAIMMLQKHIMETDQMYQQVMMMRQAQQAQAMQMQAEMAKYGVRPGQSGSTETAGPEAQPGSQAEGVQSAPAA